VEDVLIDKAWLPGFRVIITLLQNCL
jgi:hypothetical protein